MKRVTVICVLLLAIAGAARAQRYAVVDMKYILSKLPEYAKADTSLKLIALRWQKEIDSVAHFADSLSKDFDAEKYMLADELKAKRMLQIENAYKRVRDLQTRYFGYEGELFIRRSQMVQPIQNKIYSAVQQLSVKNGWDFVLDKSDGTSLLFSDPKLNKSDDVLASLGIKVK